MENLTCIITGDIISSTTADPKTWVQLLKKTLSHFGKQPQVWDIYRGDMFQLEVPVEDALEAALFIKVSLRYELDLDARMGIGIGEITFRTNRLPESNGSAFIHSGSCFDNLKKRRLAIKTPWDDFDKNWNVIFNLALLTIDNWSMASSHVLKTAVAYPDLTQREIAKKLNKSQSTISAALLRTGYDEIEQMKQHFKDQIIEKMDTV